jgi:hypothetical protein
MMVIANACHRERLSGAEVSKKKNKKRVLKQRRCFWYWSCRSAGMWPKNRFFLGIGRRSINDTLWPVSFLPSIIDLKQNARGGATVVFFVGCDMFDFSWSLTSSFSALGYSGPSTYSGPWELQTVVLDRYHAHNLIHLSPLLIDILSINTDRTFLVFLLVQKKSREVVLFNCCRLIVFSLVKSQRVLTALNVCCVTALPFACLLL